MKNHIKKKKKKMWYKLFEKFFARQLYWIFLGDKCKEKMKILIMKNNIDETKLLDKVYINKLEDYPNFKTIFGYI